LTRLSAAAAARPEPAPGRYDYVRTVGWYLASSWVLVGDRLEHLDRRIERGDREIWVAVDGSGRIEETRGGRRSDVSGVFPSAGLYRPEPPIDQADVHAQTDEDPLRCVELLDLLWSACVVPPSTQALLLRTLADRPGIDPLRPAVDRLGRVGLGLELLEGSRSSRSEGRRRHRVLFDEQTGALLAHETVVLDEQDWLPEPAPATDSYTAWLAAGRVPTP
jgi:hypothetical protein